MNSSQSHVSRACESLMTLLLLEYLYCFYLDASLLVLLFRLHAYYIYRVIISYNADKAAHVAESERDAAHTPQTTPSRTTPARRPLGRSPLRSARQATTSATTNAPRESVERDANTAAINALRSPNNNTTNNTAQPNAVQEESRLRIFISCCWRFALIALLHTMYLGPHYLNAAPPRQAFVPLPDAMRTGHMNSQAVANESAAADLFVQEVNFWRSYLNNRHFIDFAAAWEPFTPLPCVVLVLDIAALVLEYLIGVLVTIYGDKAPSEDDTRPGDGHVLGHGSHTTAAAERRSENRQERREGSSDDAAEENEDRALDEIYASPPPTTVTTTKKNDNDSGRAGRASARTHRTSHIVSTQAVREGEAEVEMRPMTSGEHKTTDTNTTAVKLIDEAAFASSQRKKDTSHTSMHLRRHGQPWYRTVSDEEPGYSEGVLHQGDVYEDTRDGWRRVLWRLGRRAWRAVFCGWRRELFVLLPPTAVSPQSSSLSSSELSRHAASPTQ